jgi:hypothetical protein
VEPAIRAVVVGSLDPIDEFEKTFTKRIRFFVGSLVGGSLFPVGILAYLFVAFSGTFGALILVCIPIELVWTLVIARWFGRRLKRVRALPRAMRRRLAPSGVGKRPTFVFDNGLVVTSGFQYRMFGSPMGGTMIPTSAEVSGLERGIMRMRPVLRIFRNHGPESLRVRLNSIQKALNARFSSLLVFLPRPSSGPDARHPSWVASASFTGGFSLLDPDRILQQIDSLAALLENAVTMARDNRA